VAARVERSEDLYRGPHAIDAPDLTVGFAHGYRASHAMMTGLPPRALIAANRGRWSGDHASMDRLDTAGVFIASVKPAADRVRLHDLAATALGFFGVPAPPSIEGRVVLPLPPQPPR
jgi:hypothetical protein